MGANLWRAVALPALLALAAACFTPDIADQGFSCADDRCPEGFACVRVGGKKVCRPEGTPGTDAAVEDLGLDAAADADKDLPDAGPDARPDAGADAGADKGAGDAGKPDGGACSPPCPSYGLCVKGACTLGTYHFVTTALSKKATTSVVRTVRGEASFTNMTSFNLTWADDTGKQGSGAGTVSVTATGEATMTQLTTTEGQISKDGQLMAFIGVDASDDVSQLVLMVRKSLGHTLADVANATFRVLGTQGVSGTGATPAGGWLWAVEGTMKTNAFTVASGALRTSKAPTTTISLTGLATPKFKVNADGAMELSHRQDGKDVVYSGQLAPDNSFALVTRDQGPSDFEPGTLLLVRTSTGLSKASLKGDFTLSHLVYGAAGTIMAAQGEERLDGNGAIATKQTAIKILNPPVKTYTVLGVKYDVSGAGAFVAENADSSGHIGQNAGHVLPSPAGATTSEAIFSSSVGSYQASAAPISGSLIVWIRQF